MCIFNSGSKSPTNDSSGRLKAAGTLSSLEQGQSLQIMNTGTGFLILKQMQTNPIRKVPSKSNRNLQANVQSHRSVSPKHSIFKQSGSIFAGANGASLKAKKNSKSKNPSHNQKQQQGPKQSPSKQAPMTLNKAPPDPHKSQENVETTLSKRVTDAKGAPRRQSDDDLWRI